MIRPPANVRRTMSLRSQMHLLSITSSSLSAPDHSGAEVRGGRTLTRLNGCEEVTGHSHRCGPFHFRVTLRRSPDCSPKPWLPLRFLAVPAVPGTPASRGAEGPEGKC